MFVPMAIVFSYDASSHFYRLSFSRFPRCYARRPDFMRQKRGASQSNADQISFMLNQHLCSNQTWVISSCVMLVDVSAKITDKLASRWKVTCPARERSCGDRMASRSPEECNGAFRRHLLGHRRRDRQGQKRRGWPCKAATPAWIMTQCCQQQELTRRRRWRRTQHSVKF